MSYFLNYNKWKRVYEAMIAGDQAEKYAADSGLVVKTLPNKEDSELISGGPIESVLIDVVREIKNKTGFELKVTAGNDEFHQKMPKVSNHKLGKAIDFTFPQASNKDARKNIEIAIANIMLSGAYAPAGLRLGAINEYDRPTSYATGGHFHLSLGPDTKERDDYECNLSLIGITSYSQIRKLKESGVSSWSSKAVAQAAPSDISLDDLIKGKMVIKSGYSGEIVFEIQNKLKELGLFTKEATGEYDADTYNAIKSFQSQNIDPSGQALKSDGIVGKKTAAALFKDELEDVEKASDDVGEVTPSVTKYDNIVATVIDKLEGGYYHPDMLKDGRVKDKRYGSSGETMMGIDREAGGKLNETPEAKEFWKIIDQANARKKWPWLYRGGNLESKLRTLAGKIIKPEFEKLQDRYLSPQAKKIVNKDGRLLFHFVYATWNGAGWFKKFANDINSAIKKGTVSPNELVKVAIASRTKEGLTPGSSPNSIIAQSGKKIEKIISSV